MMVAIVSSGMSTSGGMEASGDTQSRVAALQAKIKGLVKSIGQIQKQIADEPDPKARKVLIKMIENLQQTIQMIQLQIQQLERNERQKELNRIEARRQNEAEGKLTLPGSDGSRIG
ncbi:hypothetical protein CSQ96_10815 [Janthinobacterium sp. BJB412]|nr:hypothetical protein CSQ96_10815 [Janthinobacterium sp. BJB412]